MHNTNRILLVKLNFLNNLFFYIFFEIAYSVLVVDHKNLIIFDMTDFSANRSRKLLSGRVRSLNPNLIVLKK